VTDIARLQLRIDSIEMELAERRTRGLTKAGKQAERATDRLRRKYEQLGKVIGVALGAGIAAATHKLVSITREFDILNAQLITATGSAEGAGLAFEAIQDFAATTPYDLQQVTEAFVKLVNLGLTPSEAALTSYGNTASAMGKSLNQMIEAVADAATGEFERLKEFGIKAKSEGENVTFTFRGVKTTVRKEANEIESYLMKLGEVEFAGAMEQRMDSLDGALSNLGDEWDKLWLNISQQGIGDLIEETVRTAIGALESLNTQLASGEIIAKIDLLGLHFQGLESDIEVSTKIISVLWDDLIDSFDFPSGFSEDIEKNLETPFQTVRTTIKLLTNEVAAFVDGLASDVQTITDVVSGTGFEAAMNAAIKREEAIQKNRKLGIITYVEEHEKATSKINEQEDKIAELRKKRLQDRLDNEKKASDRLSQFYQGAGDSGGEDGETTAEKKARERREKEAERLKTAREREFQSLVDSLRSEEEVIQDSYDRRLSIILMNTEEGSRQQAELKSRLDEEYATKVLGGLDNPDTYDEQIAQINDFYDRRRELILNNVALTEVQRTELEEELTRQRNEKLAALEAERTSNILQSNSKLFGELAGLAKGFAGEQSTIYRAMFAASKAFAVAEAVIKIQQGIANAASLPFPSNLGAISSVISATSGVISTINGTQYSGAYDKGGRIPTGKFGLVGEYGPELVEGPANVRSRRETADMFRDSQAPPAQVNLTNINVLDPSIVGDYLGTAEGEQQIMNVVNSNQG
jgi:hypothetical protein